MKTIFISLLFIFLAVNSYAMFGLITKDNVKNELSLLRAENKGEMNAFKLQNQGDISALKMKIDKLEMNLDANLQAVAGFNNQVQKISAGRDMNTSTTNDTGLMKKIIAGLCGVIGGAFGIITLLIKRIFTLMNNIIDDTQAKSETYKTELFRKSGVDYKTPEPTK